MRVGRIQPRHVLNIGVRLVAHRDKIAADIDIRAYPGDGPDRPIYDVSKLHPVGPVPPASAAPLAPGPFSNLIDVGAVGLNSMHVNGDRRSAAAHVVPGGAVPLAKTVNAGVIDRAE